MKKFILVAIILKMLFSFDLNQTEDNIYQSLLSIKHNFIFSLNSVLPDYLNIQDSSTFKISYAYDSLNESGFSFGANIRVFYFKLKKTKSIFKSKRVDSKEILFLFAPYLRVYSGIPTMILDNKLLFKRVYFANISLLENVKLYPLLKKFENIILLKFQYKNSINKLEFDYDSKSKITSHTVGIYYLIYKQLLITGIQSSGNNRLSPFLYDYKLFLNVHINLFHKNHLFIDIIPYIFFSKFNHFRANRSIYLGITYKF